MIDNLKIDSSVFVADGAKIIGNVTIGEDSSVWYNAVLRSDGGPIIIGKSCSVQDNAVLHMEEKYPLTIGNNVTIGHGAIVHGCTVENNCIIGMGSIIMNGALIGHDCIIGAGALITENDVIPDYSVVIGQPGRIIRKTTPEDSEKIVANAAHYVELAKKYM